MLDVDWDVYDVAGPRPAAEDEEGGALVAAVVVNDAPVARRIRLSARTEGPLHPPRRRGVPEAGWTGDGFEGVVPAGGHLALGFAAAGPVPTPPIEVVDRGRASGDAGMVGGFGITGGARDSGGGEASAGAGDTGGAGSGGASGQSEPTPTDLLRELGSPAPPRDAVPDPEADAAASEGVPGADVDRDRRSP